MIKNNISSEHLQFKNNNVSWNENIEKNIKELGEKSKGYKIMHIKEANNMRTKYNLLMYTGICLGPLSGLLSGIGATLNPDAPTTFPIISACVAFISGIVVAITRFGKFEEKSSHHKIAASKYTSLESNVRRQLILSREERVQANQYLEWIGNSFDDLFLASPLLTKNIYKQYVNFAKINKISVPDEYQININIDEEYQLQKFEEIKDSSEININLSSTQNNNLSSTQNNNLSKQNFKGNKEIKRTNSLSYFNELNQFSDGRMIYEMKRMMGLK